MGIIYNFNYIKTNMSSSNEENDQEYGEEEIPESLESGVEEEGQLGGAKFGNADDEESGEYGEDDDDMDE